MGRGNDLPAFSSTVARLLCASLSVILYLAGSSALQAQSHNRTRPALAASPPGCQLDARKTGHGYPMLSSMACCTVPSCLDRHVYGAMGMNRKRGELREGTHVCHLISVFLCSLRPVHQCVQTHKVRMSWSTATATAPLPLLPASLPLLHHCLFGYIKGRRFRFRERVLLILRWV